ncbi:beta-ketoacyl synthase N-terminal-like domain-containing protein [Amycolatopsis sp. NPDC051128]|uniref:beta-ketoacyl synthase N-terminal-like domain-containing protein n=1 Tax=Amycolatopsis sp. NPDC051128 TaxID=3155412 RepID=UPI0034252138
MNVEKVGITGIGAVTAYGWGRESLWDGLVSGKPAAALTDGYGLTVDEPGWVALVPDGGDEADGPSRFTRAVRATAREAIADAVDRGWQQGRRVGLLHAMVLGDVNLWRDFYRTAHDHTSRREYLALMPSTVMAALMRENGFHGPAMTVSAMCASGNAGLITAKSWLDAGIVDDVLLVVTDLSVTRENIRNFVHLGVVITDAEPLDACRPFQEGSRGFIMGEASVAFVLSRSAPEPYALVLGGAMTHDAYHAISIDPKATEVHRCFREALTDAQVSASDVRYLNAHGPGTRQCDTTEARMLETHLPATAQVYSVKPLTGHCQAAAAAVEVAVAALGYDRGLVPAPPTVAPGHPQLLNGHTPISGGLTLKSSLGMGGHNAVVILAPGQSGPPA